MSLGVAFSGGGDSTALLHHAVAWARDTGGDVVAATVDHGLREGSRSEAEAAGARARALGVDHEILVWRGVKRAAGLQDGARRARYRLLCGWAAARGLDGVLLGHTRDDVGETHVMRAARGGPDYGRAAMAEDFRAAAGAGPAVSFLRPFLHVSRSALRRDLRDLGADWIEDPSNADDRFERARLRKTLDRRDGEAAAKRAFALAEERRAMEASLLKAAARAVHLSPFGFAQIDMAAFRGTPDDLRPRLLSWVLSAVAGTPTPAPGDALRRLSQALAGGDGASGSLHGCILTPWRRGVAVVREGRALDRRLRDAEAGSRFWDRRFAVPDGRAAITLEAAAARRLARDHDGPWRAFAALPARGGAAYFEADRPWAQFLGAYPSSQAIRRF